MILDIGSNLRLLGLVTIVAILIIFWWDFRARIR